MAYNLKTLSAFSQRIAGIYSNPPAPSARQLKSRQASPDSVFLARLEARHRVDSRRRKSSVVESGKDQGRSFHRLRSFGLTPRECEVVCWISEGKTDAEIADKLGCATKTVSKHVEHLLAKLGAETRLGAVQTATKFLGNGK
jgi:DNA-binding CsgD family transcriptional regulator